MSNPVQLQKGRTRTGNSCRARVIVAIRPQVPALQPARRLPLTLRSATGGNFSVPVTTRSSSFDSQP